MVFGKLTHVALREQWIDEAKDFTPWLASDEGLALLGETLGMELELEDTEVYVGNYRADIVAKDTPSNQYVVIENQLSLTDHDHIGKLLTYAASFGAKTIVWIAKEIREEHRQALDWFNDITIQDVDFFGIEIELLRIGNSPFAPNLKIVSKPNEWTRRVRAETQRVTEVGSRQIEFWTAFNGYLEENQVDIRQRKPGPQHWYDVAVGKSGIHISMTVRFVWGNDIGCEMYIGTDDAKELFHFLYEKKDQIESIVGNALEWKELPEGKVSRVVLRQKTDPNDSNNWEECFQWYADKVTKFRKAFVPDIKRFNL